MMDRRRCGPSRRSGLAAERLERRDLLAANSDTEPGPRAAGTIRFAQPQIGQHSFAEIILEDADLLNVQVVEVVAISSDSERESLSLTAYQPGRFRGGIQLTPNASAAEDGILTVEGNREIRVEYLDANLTDGTPGTVAATTVVARDTVGNLAGDAKQLEVNVESRDAIDHHSDVDWYSFSAAEGEQYSINAGSGSALDVFVRLYGPDGETLLTADDDSGNRFDARIEWTAPASGTYFFEVSSLVPARTGSFTAFVQGPSVSDPNDDHADIAGPEATVVGPGTTVGAIEEPGDVDVFAVELQAGSTNRFEVILGSDWDSTLQLLAPDRVTQIGFNDDAFGVGSRLDVNIFSSGTYYLVVAGFGSNVGAYDLLVATGTDDHPDVIGEGYEPVSLRQPLIGTIGRSGDKDVIAVEMTEGEQYVIDVGLQSLGDSVLRLYRPDGQLLASNDDGGVSFGSRIAWTARETGTHFAEVTGFGSLTGTYQLTALDFPAVPITLEQSLEAELDELEQFDRYVVEAEAGVRYEFDVLLGSMRDSVLELYSSGNDTPIERDDDGGEGRGSRITWLAPESGSYKLHVRRRFSSDNGTYTISVNQVVDDHADIPGDSLTVANAGELSSGQFEFAGDVDIWAIDLVAGQNYQLSGIADRTAAISLQVLHFEQQLPILSSTLGTTGTATIADWKSPESGRYFVEVRTGRTFVGSYDLNLESVDQHADGSETATSLTVPTELRTSVDAVADLDWYRFDGIAGTNYVINARMSEQVSEVAVRLFDEGGIELAAGVTDESGGSTIEFVPESDGPLLVRVSGAEESSGLYELRLGTDVFDDDDHGNAADLATPVELPLDGSPFAMAARLESLDDVDVFALDAEPNQFYEIQVTGSTLADPRLRVFDSSGTDIAFVDDVEGSLDAGATLAVPAAGEYFLAIDSPPGTGAYDVGITVTADDHVDAVGDGAVRVELGSAITGNLYVPGDVDLFALEVDAPGDFLITPPANLFVGVLDANAEPVVFFPELNNELAWTAVEPGRYFLAVEHRPGVEVQGPTDYEFIVDVAPDDYPDGPAEDPAFISIGETVSGLLEVTNDMDVFAIDLTPADGIEVTLQTPGASIAVLAEDGTELALPQSSPIVYKSELGGRHYVQVRRFSAQGREYTFTLDRHADDFPDYPTPDATPIERDVFVDATLEISRDADLFPFDVDAGQIVRADFRGRGLDDANLEILDGQGNLLAVEFFDTSLDWTAGESGRYFLRVSDFRTGTYRVRVNFIEDDHVSVAGDDATPLTYGERVSGEIEVSGDSDVFAFELLAGETIELTVRGSLDDPSLDVVDFQTERRFDDGVYFSAPQTGTYYVAVRSSSTGTYSIEGERLEDDHPDTVVDGLTTAAVGESLAGVLESVGDHDIFAFDFPANSKVEITTESTGTLQIELFNEDFDVVTRSNVWSAPAGRHYIDISSFSGEGTYAFILTQTFDDHLDTTTEGAAVLGPDEELAGTIETAGDRDVFEFFPVPGKRYQFDAIPGEGVDTELGILDPFSRRLASNDDAQIGNPASRIIWDAPGEGPFYMSVRSFRGRPGDYRVSYSLVGDSPQEKFDVNQDGQLNAADVDWLLQGRVDFNEDGRITDRDFDGYLAAAGIRQGDANVDGRVDFDDFLALSGSFGANRGVWSDGDFNGDRLIDFADFLILSQSFDSD